MQSMETKDLAIPEEIVEIWQRIVNSVAIYLSVPGVMINRILPPELEVFRSNISPESPIPSGTRLKMNGLYCTEVALRNQKLQISNALHDDHWSDSPTAKRGIIAYLGVPLLWSDGSVFGTLCAVDLSENQWEERASNLLITLKDIIESHLALILTNGNQVTGMKDLESALNEVLTLQGFRHLSPADKKNPE